PRMSTGSWCAEVELGGRVYSLSAGVTKRVRQNELGREFYKCPPLNFDSSFLLQPAELRPAVSAVAKSVAEWAQLRKKAAKKACFEALNPKNTGQRGPEPKQYQTASQTLAKSLTVFGGAPMIRHRPYVTSEDP